MERFLKLIYLQSRKKYFFRSWVYHIMVKNSTVMMNISPWTFHWNHYPLKNFKKAISNTEDFFSINTEACICLLVSNNSDSLRKQLPAIFINYDHEQKRLGGHVKCLDAFSYLQCDPLERFCWTGVTKLTTNRKFSKSIYVSDFVADDGYDANLWNLFNIQITST